MKRRTIGILAALLAALAVSAWALFGRTPAATSLSGVTSVLPSNNDTTATSRISF